MPTSSGGALVFGAYAAKGKTGETSIPHRDFVYCFVFDLFYEGSAYESAAATLQEQMQDLVDQNFSPGQERRVFWGTFGDTDMAKDSVRRMYYDSDHDYAKLQALKKEVDPDDLFHTSLTVQLP